MAWAGRRPPPRRGNRETSRRPSSVSSIQNYQTSFSRHDDERLPCTIDLPSSLRLRSYCTECPVIRGKTACENSDGLPRRVTDGTYTRESVYKSVERWIWNFWAEDEFSLIPRLVGLSVKVVGRCFFRGMLDSRRILCWKTSRKYRMTLLLKKLYSRWRSVGLLQGVSNESWDRLLEWSLTIRDLFAFSIYFSTRNYLLRSFRHESRDALYIHVRTYYK